VADTSLIPTRRFYTGRPSENADNTVATVKGVLRACCADDRNLVAHPQSSDLTVRICRVCDRRHYEFGADAGHFGLELR
jgi:hypothetical protein